MTDTLTAPFEWPDTTAWREVAPDRRKRIECYDASETESGMPCATWTQIEFREIQAGDIFKMFTVDGTQVAPGDSPFLEACLPEVCILTASNAEKQIEHGVGYGIKGVAWGRLDRLLALKEKGDG